MCDAIMSIWTKSTKHLVECIPQRIKAVVYLIKWLVSLHRGGEIRHSPGKDQIGQSGRCGNFTQQLNGQNKMRTVFVAHNEASVVFAISRTDLKSNRDVCLYSQYYSSGKVTWNHLQSKLQYDMTILNNYQKQELFYLFFYDRALLTSTDTISTGGQALKSNHRNS